VASASDYPPCRPGLKRYRIRFYSGNYEDEGCSRPSFPVWISSQRDRRDPDLEYGVEGWDAVRSLQTTDDEDLWDWVQEAYARDDCCFVGFIDAHSYQSALVRIGTHFPDYYDLEIEQVAYDWLPGSRFP